MSTTPPKEIYLREKKLFNCSILFWEYILRPLILKEEILKELKRGGVKRLEENKESWRGKGGKNYLEPAVSAEFKEEEVLIDLIKPLIEAMSIFILLSMAECFSLIA
ncbi:hypothetical protein RCL_jg16945.t1 [Rhizophagus clarus]|uniref:Uncharacterized protein n=1 Tax=Rhizophagus clarus TaxID=94130 RepID=A0A8H3M3F9_9GLOM|nr:hypothetical protein RCL_jg16945.t1 [Rhizophagus clarus]